MFLFVLFFYQMFILKSYFLKTRIFRKIKVKTSNACIILSFYLNKAALPASFKQFGKWGGKLLIGTAEGHFLTVQYFYWKTF